MTQSALVHALIRPPRSPRAGRAFAASASIANLAGYLAEAASKPHTGEQVIAIHDKLIAANPELAEDAAVTAQLTDENLVDDLAEEANEIQATKTNQVLGSGEDADEAYDDSGDVAEGDDSEDNGVAADAA